MKQIHFLYSFAQDIKKSAAVNVFQDLSYQNIGGMLTLNRLIDDVAQRPHAHHSLKHDKL